ncbi:MAG: NAD-dependent protein deacetylase [Lysobacter sp.]|nr:NAD-dependent protein deacetylase [Lysobacter sp.]
MTTLAFPLLEPAIDTLAEWIARHPRLFVLTGAGCSTASGIPDYRDRDGAWKRSPPVTIQAFTGNKATYRRYWARSFVGWPRIDAAEPNAAHHALASLQRAGRLSALVTQNVDGLHQRAGSRDAIDLHGRLDQVVCLGCDARIARDALQQRLLDDNHGWAPSQAEHAPDGDAVIDDDAVARFRPPACEMCGAMLKPDVVFFGENVPRARYEQAVAALHDADADAMLVAGSSLMVYSGFRFARMAQAAGRPLAIINRGRTRADELAELKVDADVGAVLQAVMDRYGA